MIIAHLNIVLLTRAHSNSSFLTRKTRQFSINTTFNSSPQSSLQETTRAACGKERLDDDKRSPFMKRFEYIEHSIDHSFQLNYVLLIRKSGIRNSESGIRNPESGIRNPESGTRSRNSNWGKLGTTESSSAVKSFSIYNTRKRLIYSQHLRYYQDIVKLGN